MSYLYLDIETIETQDADLRARIAADIKPPASMSKAETIAKWEAEAKPDAIASAIAKTALDGAAGHVVCIGYAFADGPAMAQMAEHHTDEVEILSKFLEAVKALVGFGRPVIVGHNIAWDLRFLTQRAIVLGVPLPHWWPRDTKPWSQDIFCTMTAWAGAKDTISLDRLCRTLGITGKGDVTGADVRGMWYAGQFDAIGRYCMGDVNRTRAIHRKMQVAFGEIEKPAEPVPSIDDDAAFLAEGA